MTPASSEPDPDVQEASFRKAEPPQIPHFQKGHFQQAQFQKAQFQKAQFQKAQFQKALRDAVNGDQGAFHLLIADQRQALANYVRRTMDRRLNQVMDVEDVLQDVYLHAFRSLSEVTLDDGDAMQAWLCRIAHNRLIDLCRRHFSLKRSHAGEVSLYASRSPTPSGAPQRHCDQLAASGHGPISIIWRQELAEKIDRVMQALPTRMRQVLRMSLVDRLTSPEIAERLAMTPPAVRQTLRRGIARCQRYLGVRAPAGNGLHPAPGEKDPRPGGDGRDVSGGTGP